MTAPTAPASGSLRRFALIGNPNSGKTSIFNALTGMRQKVGNYPGVTVERKEGVAFSQHGKPLTVIDLPGTYSLQPRSPDERVLVDVLLGRLPGEVAPEGLVCVVDASNLERNLYLVTQVLELGLPTIVALNMMDVVQRRGVRIDIAKLSAALGVPVVPVEGNRAQGIVELRLAMSRSDLPAAKSRLELPALVAEASEDLAPLFRRGEKRPAGSARAEARLFLSSDGENGAFEALAGPARTRLQLWRQRLDREIPGWRSELITLRYGFIGRLLRETTSRFNPHRASRSERLDRILLHPVGGLLALGAVMVTLFYSIFSLAAPAMDFIDWAVSSLGEAVAGIMPEGDVQGLVVDGIIAGVGGVVIFLPQILMLFFFISLLESTGYMARAAFLLDRVMSQVGLHGRSFVPLLSSYACAVPGIMATRTIESFKDRLVTILVAPFMTCSARLPVYLVLIAALLPPGERGAWRSALLLFGLYFLGTAMALLFGLIFKRTLLRGATPSMVLELPPYRLPQLRWVLLELWDRGGVFLRRAGTIIFGLSIILWFLMNFPHSGADAVPHVAAPVVLSAEAEAASTPSTVGGGRLENSLAGRAGRALEPLFAPLGYDWKVTVGLIASFAAREVFVSTMAIIYNVEDFEDAEEATLVETLRRQKRANGEPVFTPLTCLSLMVFFAFALQCLSTVAVVKRETNSWRWPIFQLGYMFAVAWICAFLLYQGGRVLGFS